MLAVGAVAATAATGARRDGVTGRLPVVTAACVLAAVVLVPTVAAVSIVTDRLGPFDTPFQPVRVTAAVRSFFGVLGSTEQLLPVVERARNGAPFLMATQTSALAAPFIFDSGQEVLPIGGFTGTIPEPTLAALESLVHRGAFHLVVQSSSATDPRLVWITHHCLALPPARGPGIPSNSHYANFYCTPRS